MGERKDALSVEAFYDLLQQDGARAEFIAEKRLVLTRLPGRGLELWAVAEGKVYPIEGGKKIPPLKRGFAKGTL